MANSKTDVLVYIGRFNPFHRGHEHVLRRAMERAKLVIVLVGSSGQARSLKNPFTFNERRDMIYRAVGDFPDHVDGCELRVLSLRDHQYNDALWIKSVQDAVSETVREVSLANGLLLSEISLTGSDRDHSTWYLKSFPQWKSDLLPEHKLTGDNFIVSATSVREILFAGTGQSVTDGVKLKSKVPPSTVDFLIEFMGTPECAALRQEYAFIRAYKDSWSSAPYPPIFVTTDAVVVQSGHVLVVERGAFPGKGLWALPGGFLGQHERLADGCIRELIEETGIKVPEVILRSIIKTAHKEIFDAPHRSSRGRTITTAFLIRLDDTKPLPKVKGQNVPLHESGGREIVETAKAFWLPIGAALEHSEKWFEDHHGILSWGVSLCTSQ